MLLDIPREKLDLLLELREHYMVYLLSNTNRIHWEYACEQMFSYRGFRVNDFLKILFCLSRCIKPSLKKTFMSK